MKYTPEKFELKDGRICKIREIQVKDATETVEYLKTVQELLSNLVEDLVLVLLWDLLKLKTLAYSLNNAVLFFNFRPDRARQISRAFTEPDFDGFVRGRAPRVTYVCLTEYDPYPHAEHSGSVRP